MSDRARAFLLGFCAVATGLVAERAVAPFYGLGPFLTSGALAVSLLGLAAGLAWGGRRGGGGSVVFAAVLTALAPWVRTPLLGALEPAGLRIAALTGLTLFAGLPLALLGAGLASRRSSRTSEESTGPAAIPWAAVLLGAAVAAPFVTWIALPSLGVARTALAVAILEVLAALIRPRDRGTLAVFLAAIVVAGVALSWRRHGAVRRDLPNGLVEARETATGEVRVLERADGRFLVADGTLQTMVSATTGDPLWRPAAALRILDFFLQPGDSVLVLGLRGGAMAQRLARDGRRVRAVEPDASALRAAREGFSFHLAEVPTERADLRAFARRRGGRYGAVIVDAYGASAVPATLVTDEFFGDLARHVTPDGVLALAVVARGWDDPLVRSLAATLRRRFRTVQALPTSEPPNHVGSIVLLASNRELEIPDERLPQPTALLVNPEALWNVTQMNHAWFNRYAPGLPGARVLTDDRSPVEAWSDAIQRAARRDLHESLGFRRVAG